MVFEHIEKLKSEYTDKFVVVQNSRPELRRFEGMTGTVKTVNMSGRALVEFDAFNNIGWYDIDVDYLKVVDKPLAKEEVKQAEKPAAKAKPEKKTAAADAGMSVADILAAARTSGKSPAQASPTKAVPAQGSKQMSVEEMLAAARANTGAGKAETPAAADKPAAKKDPSNMSVEEMLAAARGEKSGGGAAAPAGDDAGKKQQLSATLEAARRPVAGSESRAKAPANIDPKNMTVEQMLAAARGETAKGAAASPPAEARAEAPVEETPEEEASAVTPTAAGPLPTETAEIVSYCRQVDGG